MGVGKETCARSISEVGRSEAGEVRGFTNKQVSNLGDRMKDYRGGGDYQGRGGNHDPSD